MRVFQIANVHCQNCANIIKSALEDEFGPIDVNVEKRQISLNIAESKLDELKSALKELGYELLDEVKG